MDPTVPDFDISETRTPDGPVIVALSGELDLAVAGRVGACLDRLREAGDAVRLDLSRIEFIDSSGLQSLFLAVRAAHDAGQAFAIAPDLAAQVRRVIELVDGVRLLWPRSADGEMPAAGA